MIKVNFTQADVGGAPQTALASWAEGGLYTFGVGGLVTPGAGAGGFGYIRLTWTDAAGDARQYDTTFFAAAPSQPGLDCLVATVSHPSNISVRIVNGSGLTGNFNVEAHVYISRLREEGSD